ncbi:E3 ubiquitin ligase BIG BROTHER isoform X2 [Tripterygium wilfordii]|uniref:E3 ubiquitin ligase BIG BROTHER isoform X2 n=1 Tax=Tripterygium wilfordii TaxID=458696 RepID=A0A7J7E2H9_TRIWF|nr:E3 ubiquitin-protein ligase BIG BROTHER-like isoform X1 [Tripterygium wilfordii]XP_038701406.1 E3 ubiquitin-protein ligase BIG BROTHER-like isoform X2 [Tripterygium wilfordii]KAF5752664.1 E3 ubiquitin ligase BIG BROTHER isoform X2 [Tripterygium wilfordii]
MNGNRQMEMHYIDTGCPYTVTESFVDFFEGLTHLPPNYSPIGPIIDQENGYWSTNLNAYKFGPSGPGGTSYHGHYDINDHLMRMDISNRAWGYPSTMNVEDPATTDVQSEDADMSMHAIPEERIADTLSTNTSQVVLQDNFDPDDMTYEELLELGEAVGAQSRGLSQELIDLLPTSKCKLKNIFSRKRSGERCVICQTKYKRGDKQMKLPCIHIYHSKCITKWLSINKICPVCNAEVFGEESRHL